MVLFAGGIVAVVEPREVAVAGMRGSFRRDVLCDLAQVAVVRKVSRVGAPLMRFQHPPNIMDYVVGVAFPLIHKGDDLVHNLDVLGPAQLVEIHSRRG